LQTLPLALVFYFQGLGNALMPREVRTLGRRGAYLVGTCFGVLGNVVIALACWSQSFVLLCLGACLEGCAMAHAQNYRFGAVLFLPSNPPKAISYVLFGGCIGALFGPGVLARARNLLPPDFAGIYALCALCHCVGALLLSRIQFPPEGVQQGVGAQAAQVPPRSLKDIYRNPRCCVGTVAVAAAYTIMMLVMAPTPIVMRMDYGHSYDAATLVMMGHTFLMYVPSPVTGKLISRFGALPVALGGCVMIVVTCATLWSGTSLGFFIAGLVFLGVAWNLLFMAGTAQLVSCYTKAEGPKVQAFSDGLCFLLSGTSSLLSMTVVRGIGWQITQLLAICFSVVTAAIIVTPSALDAVSSRAQGRLVKEVPSIA